MWSAIVTTRICAESCDCLRSTTVAGTGGDAVFQVYVLLRRPNSCTTCLKKNQRVSQLTLTLLLRAPAETVECALTTVEDGGRERLWSGCEHKPVSADQMHSTHAAQSPRAHEIASSIVCGSKVDMAAGISTRNRAAMEKSSLLL